MAKKKTAARRVSDPSTSNLHNAAVIDAAPNGAAPDAVAVVKAATPLNGVTPIKEWAFLYYICGDNEALNDAVAEDLHELERALPSLDHVHVVAQVDRCEKGAMRYVYRATDVREDRKFHEPLAAPVRINTGDPKVATNFFEWAIRQAPARHYALFFVGLGISPKHVDDIIAKQRSLGASEQVQKFDSQSLFTICHDESHLDGLEIQDVQEVLRAVRKQLGRKVDIVAFDADQTGFVEFAYQLHQDAHWMIASRGMLPDGGWRHDKILITCDELAGLQEKPEARRQRLSQQQKHQKLGTKAHAPLEQMARLIARIAYGDQQHLPGQETDTQEKRVSEILALHLDQLVDIGQMLDHVASTLSHHLGDWHILSAIISAQGVATHLERSRQGHFSAELSNDAKHHRLPSTDLAQQLCLTEAVLKAAISPTPAEFGQKQRLIHVHDVVQSARRRIVPYQFLSAVSASLPPLIESVKAQIAAQLAKLKAAKAASEIDDLELIENGCNAVAKWLMDVEKEVEKLKKQHEDGEADDDQKPEWMTVLPSDAARGVLILHQGTERVTKPCKPASDVERANPQHNADLEADYRSRTTNYHELDFSRDVSWSLLLGAVKLIVEKPHALWRMVSSMLFSRNTASRDLLLRRILTEQSVIKGMSNQFRFLKSEMAVALTIEPRHDDELEVSEDEQKQDRITFRVRLDSSAESTAIYSNDSPVYRSTINAALDSFGRVLNSQTPTSDAIFELQQLGRSLGEDVIQDLGPGLKAQRELLAIETTVAPHLRLQIPVGLMQYPWELMADKDGMLFEHFAIGRQFFNQTPPRRARKQRSSGPLRVLIIGDPLLNDGQAEAGGESVYQLPGAKKEATAIKRLFRELRFELTGIVDVWIEDHIHQRVTVNMVRSKLRSGQYDIIHYAGHACFNPEDPEASAWVLSDGLLHAREIRNTLEWTEEPPWLVFANACEAGMDKPINDKKLRYHGDVCGLGTAFIGHGVRGYIAPLWPISDQVAIDMARVFYRNLLLDRLTLGEALFKSRESARLHLLGKNDESQGSQMPASVSLSWAGLVLYGDPTQRVFQSLWGGASSASEGDSKIDWKTIAAPQGTDFERESPSKWQPKLSEWSSLPRLTQATPRQVVSALDQMGLRRTPTSRGTSKDQPTRIELIERDGVRFWRIRKRGNTEPQLVKDAVVPVVFSSNEVRKHMGVNRSLPIGHRGKLGTAIKFVGKTLGSWLINPDDTIADSIAKTYDSSTVPKEGLFEIRDDLYLFPIAKAGLRPLADEDTELDKKGLTKRRVLLVIHGTFSCLKSPVTGFGKAFFDRFRSTHRILGYDHWTLSKTPLENAQQLARDLVEMDKSILEDGRLDLIVHSRGGLVARSLVELVKGADLKAPDPTDQRDSEILAQESPHNVPSDDNPFAKAVRNVVFIGTPNAGTQLANPERWGALADFLINFGHLDDIFPKMSAMMVEALARDTMPEFPGLAVQSPDSLKPEGVKTDLLKKLHHGETPFFERDKKDTASPPPYWFVAANYEPDLKGGQFDLSAVPERMKALNVNLAIDGIFGVPNDLVVDTHSVWALRNSAAEAMTDVGAIPKQRILLFNPPPTVAIDAACPEPAGINVLRDPGVHHCNMFEHPRVQQFIQEALGVWKP